MFEFYHIRSFFMSVAIVAGLLFSTAVSAQLVDDLRAQRTVAERNFASVSDVFEQALAEFEELARSIEARKSDGPTGPLEVLELQQQMQAALALSGVLERLQERRDEALRALVTMDAAHVDELEDELDQVLAERPWSAEVAERAAVLQAYLDERAALSAPMDVPVLDIQATREALRWSPEEMQAAADELADYQDAMQVQLDQIEAAARQARRREELEARARSMRRQESIFDDSFSRRGPSASGRTQEEATSSGGSFNDRDEVSNESGGDSRGEVVTDGAAGAPTGGEGDFGSPGDLDTGAPGVPEIPVAVGTPVIITDGPAPSPTTSDASPSVGQVDSGLFRTDLDQDPTDTTRSNRRRSSHALEQEAEALRQRVQQAESQERLLRSTAEESQRIVD